MLKCQEGIACVEMFDRESKPTHFPRYRDQVIRRMPVGVKCVGDTRSVHSALGGFPLGSKVLAFAHFYDT